MIKQKIIIIYFLTIFLSSINWVNSFGSNDNNIQGIEICAENSDFLEIGNLTKIYKL